jgi:transglycosylase-like protein with SLT domain/sporulation related protein
MRPSVSRRTRSRLAALPLLLLATRAGAQQTPADADQQSTAPPGAAAAGSAVPGGSSSDSICLLIESAAAANGLPLAFFVRVIWQESRFQPDAVGPLTRSGERARGIAQFMPRTAAERGLLDPLDPIAALPKSAEFLKALRGEFGNLGLAAAAYNAGPRRVHDWLNGVGTLPAQTRDYVRAITGRSAEDWKAAKDGDEPAAPSSCREFVARLKQAPNSFVAHLEQRVQAGAARPWGIQLSAGFSRDLAIKTYAAIEAKYREALAGTDVVIMRSTFRSRGTRDFYQVRAGADTRAKANQICKRLSAAGGACLVLRNSRGTAEAI